MPSWTPVLIALALPLAALACSVAPPVDDCRLRDADDCDVDDLACIEHVHAVVACMRGTEHALPAIDALTPDAYLARIFGQSGPPPDDDLPHVIRGLQRITLLPAAGSLPEGGGLHDPPIYYDWDRRLPIDPDRALAGLLYALILADLDAELDLRARFLAEGGSVDQVRGLAALVAGEATFYTDLALARDPDYPASAERLLYTEELEQTRGGLYNVLDWTARLNDFQDYFGAHYMRYRYLDGGPEQVSAAHDDALGSTAFVLAGAKVTIDAAFSPVLGPLPELPDQFRHIRQESLGPVLYLTVAVPPGGPEHERELARHWVGDRVLFTYNDTTDEVVVVWQLAGPGGTVARNLVFADKKATREAFTLLFP